MAQRAPEVLSIHYEVPWPNRELLSARPLRVSPLHAVLAARGAVFGSKFGWERPLYFARYGPCRRRIVYACVYVCVCTCLMTTGP